MSSRTRSVAALLATMLAQLAGLAAAQSGNSGSLNWRAPQAALRQAVSHDASRQPQIGIQRPAGQTHTPADQAIDLPLVQPANFSASHPFDDPFDDHTTQAASGRDNRSLGSRQADDATAPRLLRPDVSRPLTAPAASRAQFRPAKSAGHQAWDAIRLTQSEQESTSADPDLKSLLTPPGDSDPPTLPPLEDLHAESQAEEDTPSTPAQDDLLPRQNAESTAPDDQAAAQEEEAGTGSEAKPATPPSSILPGFDLGPEKAETPCDRMYGPEFAEGDGSAKRNCCVEDEDCQNYLRLLHRRPINTISLDIAPPFDPRPEATDADPANKIATLAKSQPRVWRDRDGRVLANGRLVDRRSSTVVIAGEDGGQVAIPQYSLGNDELCFLNAWWGTPPECRLTGQQFTPRSWQPILFTWKASALCRKPLYFEEQQLERYGHSAGPIVQPPLSAAHFVVNLLLLPYNMGVNPPNECIYALGYYRPGSCAPWLVPAFPLSLRGAAAQVAALAVVVPLPY